MRTSVFLNFKVASMASPWPHDAVDVCPAPEGARSAAPTATSHTPSTRLTHHNAGAQIFECIGFHPEVVDVAFKGTASRVGGLDFAELQKETASLVKDSAYGGLSDDDVKVFKLANYGFINALQKGRGGEEHANSPRVAKLLHASVREDDPIERKNKYNDFVKELTETAPFGLRFVAVQICGYAV